MPDPDPAPTNATPSAPPTPTTAPEATASGDGTPSMTPAQCGQRLAALFPALFAGAPKPLKLRVHADIHARAPGEFPKPVLSAFMRRLTNSTAYLHAVARGTQRFGLDGEPAGEIAPEHRQAALDELARRRERHAAQRAAEREAARAAERAEHEARVRQAQARRERAQLLRDFERTTLTSANFAALKGLSAEALEQQLALARRERAERAPMPEGRGHGGLRREGPSHRDLPREPRPERRADTPRGPRPPRPPR